MWRWSNKNVVALDGDAGSWAATLWTSTRLAARLNSRRALRLAERPRLAPWTSRCASFLAAAMIVRRRTLVPTDKGLAVRCTMVTPLR